jgi:hypothetical protein
MESCSLYGEEANVTKENVVYVSVFQENGPPLRRAIAPDVAEAARRLVYHRERYFTSNAKAENLPTVKLVLGRLRPNGVASAVTLMASAFEGTQPKRPPISVQPLPDGNYLVRDGNSTVAVAIAAGWPDVLCVVEKE